MELFCLLSTILLLQVTLILGGGFFLSNSSGIYSIWGVGNNNNACLDISFLHSGLQLWALFEFEPSVSWIDILHCPNMMLTQSSRKKASCFFQVREKEQICFFHNREKRGDL